jgi:ubiquinone/menaquinone biosynthesis C-methylase UbiE
MTSSHAKSSIEQYGARAPSYDEGNDGWHITLGLDFARWISPQPGEYALDLACGTGLVTLPVASAIGPSGKVIGIDLTPGMLAEARKKPIPSDSAPVTWIEEDITSISSLPEIQDVVQSHGGFDVITLCSALVLLPDQPACITHWSTFLRPGGRMIIDVISSNKSLQYLFSVDLRNACGLGMPFDRSWVKDIHSLEQLYKNAGLEIVQSFERDVDGLKHIYKADQAMEIFDEQTRDKYKIFAEKGKLEEARKLWPDMWKSNLSPNGKFFDGHTLYITIGRKPL